MMEDGKNGTERYIFVRYASSYVNIRDFEFFFTIPFRKNLKVSCSACFVSFDNYHESKLLRFLRIRTIPRQSILDR